MTNTPPSSSYTTPPKSCRGLGLNAVKTLPSLPCSSRLRRIQSSWYGIGLRMWGTAMSEILYTFIAQRPFVLIEAKVQQLEGLGRQMAAVPITLGFQKAEYVLRVRQPGQLAQAAPDGDQADAHDVRHDRDAEGVRVCVVDCEQVQTW
ncbi:hypothetical protein V8E53_005721 [Lactarius tabidus]